MYTSALRKSESPYVDFYEKGLIVVAAMAAIVAATPATAAALELVDLFVEAVEFLLGELAFAFGFLECREDAIEVAHDGFEAVADAVDLAAQDAIGIAVAFVAAAAAITVASTVAIPVAASAIVAAITSATFNARAIAIIAPGRFAVSLGAAFVKFVGFVRFVGGGLGNAFAFGRIVDCWWNVFVFVARPVFALAIIFISRPGIFAIRRIFGVTFARRAIVIAGWSCSCSTSATAATSSAWGTTSAPTSTASAAFAITAVAAFATRAIGTRTGRADGAFGELRFGVRLIGSGRRGRRRFPIIKRGLSRRFGGAFRAS